MKKILYILLIITIASQGVAQSDTGHIKLVHSLTGGKTPVSLSWELFPFFNGDTLIIQVSDMHFVRIWPTVYRIYPGDPWTPPYLSMEADTINIPLWDQVPSLLNLLRWDSIQINRKKAFLSPDQRRDSGTYSNSWDVGPQVGYRHVGYTGDSVFIRTIYTDTLQMATLKKIPKKKVPVKKKVGIHNQKLVPFGNIH